MTTVRLLLTVRGGTDDRAPVDYDLCVVVESDHEVADLAAALAARTDVLNCDGRLVVARLGRVLDASARLADCGLRHGDVVGVMRSGDPTPAGRAAIGPLVSLDVIAGPEAGRYLLLGAGEFVIGSTTRGPGGVLLHDDGLASSHATLVVAPNASAVIVPGDGDTEVDGLVIHGPTPLSDRSMLRMGSGRFAVRSLTNDHAAAASSPSSGWAEVAVHRTPYRAIDLRPTELPALGTPPTAREGRRFAIAALLMPLAGGSLFIAGGRTSRLAWIVLALAPLVAVIAWLDDRRSGRRASRRERAAFLARARSIGARATGARALERQARFDSAPDLAALHRRARTFDQRVWERGLETADALTVRLGLGQVDSVTQPEVPTCDDEELLDEIREALNAPAFLDDVPILLRLLDSTGVAVWGQADVVEGVVASLVMQLAVLHGPADLVIAACVHPGRSTDTWLPWLPHAQALLGRGLASPIAGDAASGSVLVRGLCEMAESQRIVLVVDDRVGFDHSTVALLAAAAPRITVIWMGDASNRIPRTSDTVVGVRPTIDGVRGDVWTMGSGSGPRDVQVELLSTRSAASMARALSPMRDASAGRTQLVPRVVALSEMTGTEVLSGDGVRRRWARYVAGSLPVAIGLGAGGPVEIDLVESGPHALVAGTSGAGKSELLQTLVVSLAANVPPTDVTFLFRGLQGRGFRGRVRAPPAFRRARHEP